MSPHNLRLWRFIRAAIHFIALLDRLLDETMPDELE